MDFLTTALYAMPDDGPEQLTGTVLTRFDPDDLTARACVYYASLDMLRNNDSIHPAGFKLQDDGVLLADTEARSALSSDMAQYVAYELGSQLNRTPQSLLDVVLYAAKYSGKVLVNSEEVFTETPGVEPILVPMSSYKVSSSSFNIYAPYRNSEGNFRTHSLMDISTDRNIPFILVISNRDLHNYAPIISLLEAVATPAFDLFNDFRCYRVDCSIAPFYTYTGEGFLNYLAYNVAQCNIGLEIMDHFIQESPKYEKEVEEKTAPQPRKKPLHSVTILSTCKKSRLYEVLSYLEAGDSAAIERRMEDAEFYISFNWVKNILQSSNRFDGDDLNEKMAAACYAMRLQCRASLLHYAIELLAQRYYISRLGFVQDPYGPMLKGGGVNGFGLKRFIR